MEAMQLTDLSCLKCHVLSMEIFSALVKPAFVVKFIVTCTPKAISSQ